nr:PREDICTED: uncharacterized protein LOC105667362 [Linepithema humile]
MDENTFHTNIYTQEHTDTQSYIPIHTQSQTNIQPYISTATHLTSHPHTSIHAVDTSHSIHTLPAHSSIANHIDNTTHANSIDNITFTNNTYQFQNTTQFPNKLRTWPAQESISQINEYQVNHTEIPRFTEGTDYKRITQEKLSSIDAELKRMNGLLHNLLKCVQSNNDRDRVPRKPACLPISSVIEMDAFEDIDDNDFREVVNYFKYIGGFNLKEAVNLCLKEGLQDSVTPSFTWWGREKDQRPLYNTRFVIAIYEAISSNRYFNKPTRSEFQLQIREALRTAKERCRSKAHKRRTRTDNHRHDFWSDDVPEQIEDERADE